MSDTKRNAGISLIRVAAMLSIVFAHICAWKGIYLYQLGSIGVEVFLFISGYLYGRREISDRKQWMIARVRRISCALLDFGSISVRVPGCAGVFS